MIHSNFNIQGLTTFGIKTRALAFAEINRESDFDPALLKNYPRHFILGGGSNVLFTKDYDGLILQVKLLGKSLLRKEGTKVFVKIGAGESWHDTVLWCIEQGWAGIENLSLIPGTVGAAPIQNIGAYGVELSHLLSQVNGIYLDTGNKFTLNNSECQFGYRDSIFKKKLKGKILITSVVLQLNSFAALKMDYGIIAKTLSEMNITSPGIKDVSNAVIAIRQSKLPNPKKLGNAGSFFKNPVIPNAQFEVLKMANPDIPSYPAGEGYTKIPAGWLIEQAGWKGKRVGNTGAHAKQSLVLVNYGNATGKEIADLSGDILNDVLSKYGVLLEREVTIM